MRNLRKKFTLGEAKGFTLIELVVVMAIIAVLAVLVIGAITIARQTAMETADRSNVRTLQTCLEADYTKFKAYCGATGQTACPTLPTTGSVMFTAMAADIGSCKPATGTSGDGASDGVTVTAWSKNSYTIQALSHDNSTTIDSPVSP